jgi:hypothetical protein
MRSRLIGTVTVSHMGLAALLRYGGAKDKEATRELLKNWPEPDREDLLRFLKGESLLEDG